MKIEIGKRYVRRDGTVTPLLIADFVPETHFAYDKDSHFVYSTKGEPLDHQVFSYMEHPCDLMMEYNDV